MSKIIEMTADLARAIADIHAKKCNDPAAAHRVQLAQYFLTEANRIERWTNHNDTHSKRLKIFLLQGLKALHMPTDHYEVWSPESDNTDRPGKQS